MREIGGNTGSVDNIVERELIDERASLQQERERLANATRGTKNSCSWGVSLGLCLLFSKYKEKRGGE